MQRDEALRWSDAIDLPPKSLTHPLCLYLFVFKLHGRQGVDKITRRYPSASSNAARERRECLSGGFLSHVEFVEEAGRVDEVERLGFERRLKDVPRNETDRDG